MANKQNLRGQIKQAARYDAAVKYVTADMGFLAIEEFPEYVGLMEKRNYALFEDNTTPLTEIFTEGQHIIITVLEVLNDSTVKVEFNAKETRKRNIKIITPQSAQENNSQEKKFGMRCLESLAQKMVIEGERKQRECEYLRYDLEKLRAEVRAGKFKNESEQDNFVQGEVDELSQKLNNMRDRNTSLQEALDSERYESDVRREQIQHLETENIQLYDNLCYYKNGVEDETALRVERENELVGKEEEISRLKSHIENLGKENKATSIPIQSLFHKNNGEVSCQNKDEIDPQKSTLFSKSHESDMNCIAINQRIINQFKSIYCKERSDEKIMPKSEKHYLSSTRIKQSNLRL